MDAHAWERLPFEPRGCATGNQAQHQIVGSSRPGELKYAIRRLQPSPVRDRMCGLDDFDGDYILSLQVTTLEGAPE